MGAELHEVSVERCRVIYEEIAPHEDSPRAWVDTNSVVVNEHAFHERQLILHSNHKLNTVEAYTHGELPKEKHEIRNFLRDPGRWIPERRKQQERLMSRFTRAAERLSSALGDQKVLIIMRGNSGSGKSYTLKHGVPELEKFGISKIAQNRELEEGIINPDNIKYAIQTELEKGQATSNQVHQEGSALAESLIEQSLSQGRTVIVDKRFGKVSDVDGLATQAKKMGYHVVVLDVDAPIEMSMSRVAERIPGGSDTTVPIDQITSGFIEARSHRAKVAALSSVDEYYLISTSNNPGPIASRNVEHGLTVEAGKEARWKLLTTHPTEAEVEGARMRWLDVFDTTSNFPPSAWAKVLATRGDSYSGVDKSFKDRVHLTQEDYDYWKKVAEQIPRHLSLNGLIVQARLGYSWSPSRYRVLDSGGEVTLISETSNTRRTLTHEQFEKLKLTVEPDHRFRAWAKENVADVAQSMVRQVKDMAAHNTGTLREHRQIADLLDYYFKHAIPNVQIARTETPNTYDRGANIRMELRNVDFGMIQRLMHDRYYQIEMFPEANGKPYLVIETGRLDPTNPRPMSDLNEFQYWDERRHHTEDNGPGFNDPDYESPGSWGREFINYAYRLDVNAEMNGQDGKRNFPNAPLAFRFKAQGVQLGMTRVEDYKRYQRDGIWAHEADAVRYRVKVDIKRAEKYIDRGTPATKEHGENLLLTSLKDLRTSNELAALSKYAIEQSRQGSRQLSVSYSTAQLSYRHPGESSESALQKEYDLAIQHYDRILSENAAMQAEATRLLARLGVRPPN